MYQQLATVMILITGMMIILLSARRISKRTGSDYPVRFARDLMFIVYIGGLIYFTFIYGGRGNNSDLDFKVRFSFLEDVTRFRYGAAAHNAFMNILLFVPLGFLLPQFTEIRFTRELKWWQNLLVCFAVTLAIESFQLLLNRGAFQTDDLLHNTIGGILGFAAACLTGRQKAD